MRQLIIALAAALTITAAAAGSALGAQPDDAACAATSGTPGLTAIVSQTGGCTSHGP